MGPAGYFIALLGCADGASMCQPVATIPIRYESREACSAATGRVLAANTDFDFPTHHGRMPCGQRQVASSRRRRSVAAAGLTIASDSSFGRVYSATSW